MTSESRTGSRVKLLLGRGSPRANIEVVEHWNEFLPCDKIMPTFTFEWEAYQQMRNYFLDHEEYTHLVLATDDIVVFPQHIGQLQESLEAHPEIGVLSGFMNVEQSDTHNINLCKRLPSKNRGTRRYDWMVRDELSAMQDIFTVEFSGFPLMAIRRDIIEDYEFHADRIFEGRPCYQGASLDLVFCYWCKEHDIPIHVDKRIGMKHLRDAGRIRLTKQNRLYFWPEKGEKVLLS